MSRLWLPLIPLAVWAAIYLPWLGSSELRSEEGHRVMPAVEMLGSGNFLVPHVAGEPYLRKPPLINWLIAASFTLTGHRNDFAWHLSFATFRVGVAPRLIWAFVACIALGAAVIFPARSATYLKGLSKRKGNAAVV